MYKDRKLCHPKEITYQALVMHYGYSSWNQPHGSWNVWYLIEVCTILETRVVFFSTKKFLDCENSIYTVIVMQY